MKYRWTLVESLQDICGGCIKQIDGQCTVYSSVPHTYFVAGECPFNPKNVKVEERLINPIKKSKRRGR